MTTTEAGWLTLQGTANTRDVGGIPARGGRVRRGRLLRSDNLQELTDEDVAVLIDTWKLATVVDLRTDAERTTEGPSPLSARREVRQLPLSLIPDKDAHRTDSQVVLPDRWAKGAVGAYMHFFEDVPQNVAAAVRGLYAAGPRASLVHCAAGKDRTGVVVAVTLEAVGARREDVAADYALTNERIERVFNRLITRSTYAVDVKRLGVDAHRVNPATLVSVMEVLDERWGGAAGYLRSIGLSDDELGLLHNWLVEPV